MKKLYSRQNETAYGKKHITIIAFILFTSLSQLNGQALINSATYLYQRSGFAPTALTAPITLIGPNSDEVASAVTNIGFTFWFAGTPYTQFSVNENGLLTLGSSQISGTDSNNNLASATTLPKIAPYWDDLATGTNGSVVYQVTGTAPNRILIINWYVTIPKNVGGTAVGPIQLQLSETTGLITFNYPSPTLPVNANLYSIGIGAAVNDFASITPTSATVASVAYGTANNSITISPGVYTRYYLRPDKTVPTISTTTIPNTGGVANRILVKTITDAGAGIPTTGTLVPRIYYKKSTDAAYVSTPGVLTTAPSTWTFTVDHSLISGGVAEGDLINYFVIAQDQAATTGVPNIASNPAGVVATDVNNITTAPTPSTYILGPSLSGTKTVGTGGDYAALTLPGGLFDLINAGSLTGNLTINIISDLTETGATALNAWANGPGGPFTITINPVGARTLNLSSNGLRLSGVNGITVDGLNDGTNSMAIQGGIKFYYGASNNTFTRLTVTGGGFTSTDASGTFPVNCSNNTISNCIIDGGYVYFGSWVSTAGVNNKILNNIIRNFGMRGIQLDRGYKDFTVSGNEIYLTTGSSYSTGIDIYLQNTVGITNVFNNNIHDLTSGTSLGMSTSGISYSGTGGTLNIYNNVISIEANSTNIQADKIYGMVIGGGTVNIYHNSIYLGGTGVTKGNSVGFYRTAGTVTLTNNAIYNARSGAIVSQYYKNYGIVTANTTNFVSDNNLIFADGVSSVLFNIGGQPGYAAGTDYTTLAAWKTASGQDANSNSANPGYTSVTNLLPDIANPNSVNLDNHGTPVASVTVDILGNSRSATTPDIGAYEFGIPYKTLNLKLFLEGLYNGSGAMNQASDGTGPNWPAGVADHITIELRDQTNYATIVHTLNDVALGTDGTITINNLPVSLNASYFITVKNRNSLETTTPTAISFAGGTISHDFTTGATQAYGENLKLNGSVFVIFSGDVNQDGAIDTGDMIPVDNDSFNYVVGYVTSDVNGDGSVDTADMIFVDNNSANYVGTMHP